MRKGLGNHEIFGIYLIEQSLHLINTVGYKVGCNTGDTPFFHSEQGLAFPASELGNTDEYMKLIPMRRLGTPEDIAKVVKFLALDTDYVTGQAIEVSGGLII